MSQTIKKTVQLDFTGQFKEVEEGLKKALNATSSKDVGKGFKEKFEKDIKEIQTLLTSLKKKADAPFTEGGLRTFEGQLNTLSRKLRTIGVDMKDFKFDDKYLKENSKEIQDLANKLGGLIKKRKELEDFKPSQTPTGKGAGATKTALGDAQKLAQSGDIKGAKALLKQQAGVLDGQAANATGPAAAQYAANSKILTDYAKSLIQTSKLITQTDTEINTLSKDLNDKLTKGYDNATKSANNANTNIENVNKTVEEMGDKARQGGEALQRLDQASERMNGIKSAINRFIGFTAVLHTMRRAIHSIFNDFKELDSQFNAIAIVTGKTMQELWAGFDKVNDIAKQYGVTAKDVVSVQKLYYQQGLQTADVNKLTAETLTLAKISGLDYAEATDKMTAAIRAFNIASEDAARVTDTLAALSSNAAATSEEIANALTKTASIAGSAGMSLESTSAFLTKMIETTRESATNIGTALKTVVARFTEVKDSADDAEASLSSFNINKVEKALKSVGVRLRDSSGQIRDLDKVFMELSKRWDGLDRNTQRYIATLAAGSRQQSRFIAMIEDYDRNLELMNIAQDAAGTGVIQLATSMDSIQSHLNILQSAWQDFYTNFISSDFFTFIIDGLTSIINAFEQMGPLLTTIFLLVGTTGVKSIVNYMSNLILLTMAKRADSAATEKNVSAETKEALSRKVADLEVKKNTGSILANAIAKLFNIEVSKAGAIGVGIAAAAVVVMTGVVIANTIEINKNTQAQLANEKAVTETIAAIKNNEKQIASTTNILIKYNRALELTKKGELATAQEKEELAELLDELEKLYPTLVTNENEHNKALNQQEGILDKLIEKQKQYVENNNKIINGNKTLIALYGKAYAGSTADKVSQTYSNILSDLSQESDIFLKDKFDLRNDKEINELRKRLEGAATSTIYSKEGLQQLLNKDLTETEYKVIQTYLNYGGAKVGHHEITNDQELVKYLYHGTATGHTVESRNEKIFKQILEQIGQVQGIYGLEAGKSFFDISKTAAKETREQIAFSGLKDSMALAAQEYRKTMSPELTNIFADIDNKEESVNRVHQFYTDLSEEQQEAYEEYITSLDDQNLSDKIIEKVLRNFGLDPNKGIGKVLSDNMEEEMAKTIAEAEKIQYDFNNIGINDIDSGLLGSLTYNQLMNYRNILAESYDNFGSIRAQSFVDLYSNILNSGNEDLKSLVLSMNYKDWTDATKVAKFNSKIENGKWTEEEKRILQGIAEFSVGANKRSGLDLESMVKRTSSLSSLGEKFTNALTGGIALEDVTKFMEEMNQLDIDIDWRDFIENNGKLQLSDEKLLETVQSIRAQYALLYAQQEQLLTKAKQEGNIEEIERIADEMRSTELQFQILLSQFSKFYEDKAKKLKDIYEAIDRYHNVDKINEYYESVIRGLETEMQLTISVDQKTQMLGQHLSALNNEIAISAAKVTKSEEAMAKERAAISKKWGKYVSFDENGIALYNYSKIQKQLDDEKVKEITEAIDKYETELQINQEMTNQLKEQILLEKQLIKTQYENIKTLQDKITGLMIQEDQKIIDSVKNRYDLIKEEDNKYLESLRQTIEKERQIRDRADTQQELEDKQYRLSLLKMDTSGTNRSAIKALEKEIANDRRSINDQMQDDYLDSLEEEFNTKAEYMDKEITYMENVQAEKERTMKYYNEKYQQLFDQGYDAIIQYMQKVDEEFIKGTSEVQWLWEDEWKNTVSSAIASFNALGDKNGAIANVQNALNDLATSEKSWAEKQKAYFNSVLDFEIGNDTSLDKLHHKYEKIIGDVNKLTQAWGAGNNGTDFGKENLDSGVHKITAVSTNETGDKLYLQLDNGKWIEKNDQIFTTSWSTFDSGLLRGADGYWHFPGGHEPYAGAYKKFSYIDQPPKITTGNGSASEGNLFIKNIIRKFIPYASGGLVDYTGPAWVDGTKSKPEAFLSSSDTELIASLRDTLRYTPSLSTPQNTEASPANVTYNIEINVEKLEDETDIDEIARQIEDRLTTTAKGNNYNLLNRR